MKKTVVVTGGAGFIGSHIVDGLVARGYRVRVLDNLCTGRLENILHHGRAVEFFQADVCDQSAVAAAVKGADCVIHQAALASVPLSLERPLDVNAACVTGTLVVLQEAHRAGVRRLVYAGSSSCYGDTPFSAKRENDSLMTISPYAVAKLAGEKYCQAWWHSFRMETVVLRYFNVFGPRQDPNSPYSAVIPLFITRMLAGQSPVVFGDGHQSRDFTFVGNVVAGNLLAMTVPGIAGKTFNLADGRATTLLQLVAALESLLGMQATVDFQPARIGDVRDSLADISLAVRELGYRPETGFQEGLARSIAWYKSQIDRSKTDQRQPASC